MNTKDYLSKLVSFDTRYKFTPEVDDNILTVDALRAIYRVISSYCNELNCEDFYIDLPNTVNLYRNYPNHEWNKWRDSDGRTWVKRYRDYVHDISGITLPSSLLGEIGETCRRVKGSSSKPWEFDFHAGVDWMPGEYAEKETSCLWSNYDIGRRLANMQGICAIRFYKGYAKVGRALLWLTSDMLLHVFNLYHEEDVARESVAKMLTEFFDGNWAFINCELDSENLFINGEMSTAVFNEDIVSRDKIYPSHSVIIDEIVDGSVMCAGCFTSVPLVDATQTYYNRYVCPECLRNYVQCNKCGEWFFPHHMHENNVCMLCHH